MDLANVRKIRLEQLLELAIAYRGWTRKELAKALGRDPTKLVPGSGVPKLDLVTELARVLDWPVGDVVSYLTRGQVPSAVDPPVPAQVPEGKRSLELREVRQPLSRYDAGRVVWIVFWRFVNLCLKPLGVCTNIPTFCRNPGEIRRDPGVMRVARIAYNRQPWEAPAGTTGRGFSGIDACI